MVEFARAFIPTATTEFELYTGRAPIFDLHGIEEEITKALDRKVPLKSGGHLCIDQTESMTTIDVNTGAYVGSRNLEETIFRTNLEAARRNRAHLRLRNLGGIIIIDFIDMQDESHRRQVLPRSSARSPATAPDAHREPLAARPRGDDAQAHAREPGTSAVPALSELRRPRLREDAGDGVSRDLSRDCATKPAVREQGAADTGSSRCVDRFLG
jgi:hypothetical protein